MPHFDVMSRACAVRTHLHYVHSYCVMRRTVSLFCSYLHFSSNHLKSKPDTITKDCSTTREFTTKHFNPKHTHTHTCTKIFKSCKLDCCCRLHQTLTPYTTWIAAFNSHSQTSTHTRYISTWYVRTKRKWNWNYCARQKTFFFCVCWLPFLRSPRYGRFQRPDFLVWWDLAKCACRTVAMAGPGRSHFFSPSNLCEIHFFGSMALNCNCKQTWCVVVDFLFFVMRAGVFICSFGAGVFRDAVIRCTYSHCTKRGQYYQRVNG